MKIFKREKYLSKIRGFYEASDLIKVITGIRRCGKSTILECIKYELLDKGIKEDHIIYLNLDKRGYRNVSTPEQLDNLIQELSKGIKGLKYLFIDEIQNVENFETIINGYREEGDYSIFITGSNSYLLSGELVTKLTGRYLEFEIFTLTFDEYIDMKKFYKIKINDDLNIELKNYINEGGFPRTVLFENLNEKREYVKNLVDEIFKKDIKNRIIIRNLSSFNLLRDYLINNSGSTNSENNIFKELNKNGNVISRSVLSRYIRILLDAKILYECNRFDMKSKKMLSGEKKYYLADLGLTFITNPDSRINYGPILENIVYAYARSFDYEINVGRIGKLECDFILKNKFLNYSYVQVAYTILNDQKTEDREYKPLERINDNYPKYILTIDKLEQKRNGIIHKNLIDFITQKNTF